MLCKLLPKTAQQNQVGDGVSNSECKMKSTVKLGFKERLYKEHFGNSELFSVTNMPVHLINNEQIGISEQLYDDHVGL